MDENKFWSITLGVAMWLIIIPVGVLASGMVVYQVGQMIGLW
jgi:hypothetical protein